MLRGCCDQRIPFFGICFGHQLFGRALGLSTYKLPYGHRGINQPVMDLTTGKVEVTSHNHGFAVGSPDRRKRSTRPFGRGRVTPRNLNDDVVEGLALVDATRLSASSTTRRPPPARTTPATCSIGFVALMEGRPVAMPEARPI